MIISQSALINLLNSFNSGVPDPVYAAVYEIIFDSYGQEAVDYFSKHVKAIDWIYYFRDSSPTPENFMRIFLTLSKSDVDLSS